MRCRSFLFCLSFIFLSLSCSTFSRHISFAGDAIIGRESDVFVFVPVGYHKNLFAKLFPNQKYLDKAINRTHYLYFSLKLKDDEKSMLSIDDDSEGLFSSINFNVCAVGRYPPSVAGMIFNKKNGWQKEKTEAGYRYYRKKEGEIDKIPRFSHFSIPNREVALFSYNSDNMYEMENILDRIEKAVPLKLGVDFEMKIQQKRTNEDICVFVSNPHLFLSKLLGLDLDFPIETVKVYLKRNAESAREFYNYSIVLDMQNITAGFTTRLLLSKLLKTQVKIEEDQIIVEKAKITTERLIQIIQKALRGL